MKILLIGATGTIGSAVSSALAPHHEVLRAGHTSGEYRVDLADSSSLRSLFEEVGSVDAVVCTAGIARFGAVDELSDDDFALSLNHKLMGQVNLVRVGLTHVSRGGSFTLTSGDLSRKPSPGTVAVAMAGGALESFGRAAALDLDGRHRVNVVSPRWVKETMTARGVDPGPGIAAAEVARAYVEVVEGDMTGQVIEL
jgi:NAD(P)-dependent dehydrogenase (short-subunit alcohol dehydrogenase family)